MRFRQKALAVKMESVYGTDPTPAIGTNDILVMKDMEVTPIEQDEVRRDIVRIEKGQDVILPTNAKTRIRGAVELAGAGTAGDAAPYGALLRACGLAETLVSETSAAYEPVSSAEESAAAYFYRGTNLHKALGIRGDVSLAFQAGQIPRFNFDLLGIYAAVTHASFPTTMDYDAFVTPIHVNKANTTFSLFGHNAVMESLTLNLGNQVAERSLVNSRTIEIPDRAPTGEATIEIPAIGTKDYFASLVAGATGVLALVHGTVAGNIVTVGCPAVQLNGQPSYSENNGILHARLSFILLPDEGDDEIAITLT